MRILVRGAYGTRNFGDDMLMLCIQKMLDDENISVDFCCPDFKYIKKISDNITVNSSNENRNYNLCIYGGGTQFFSFDAKAEKRKHIIIDKIKGNFLSPKRLLSSIKRRIRRNLDIKNDIYIGIGLGPFKSKEDEEKALKNVVLSDFVAIRDRKSLEYMNRYGGTAILGSDLCFIKEFEELLPKNEIPKDYDVSIILRDWDKSVEGIVPFDEIQLLSERLRSENKKFRFIFFSEVHDGLWINYCRVNKLEHFVWNPDKDSYTLFINEIAKSKHIISSRFHGLVFSALLNIPFTGLEIEPKIKLYMEKFENYRCIRYPFSCNELYESIEDKYWGEEELRVVEQEKQRSNEMVLELRKYLSNYKEG
ncbi:polysaccharide pyruvyl transferase family protein [Photobacterium leiognathi]|uniref:polysaccharide pyruvyl transferase family protein n=1 Tax=Photobacterium leiognathi TaxID=553611 RepID=UPI002981A1C3|nr:polysaccharide pyruvyl transferase family protein [Photobacterium leiognathi]